MEQTIIPKKCYLGNRNLETFRVNDTVKSIEDWAFAYCKKLHTIWIPKTLQYIGKQVFEGCEELNTIYVYTDICTYEQEGKLLAYAVRHFNSPGIFDFENIGSISWYKWYDECLLSYIGEPDDKDFQPFLAGGEEDYEDPDNNVNVFCEKVQQEKVRGILLRLMADAEYTGCDRFLKEMLLYLSQHKEQLIAKVLYFRENAITYLKQLGDKHIITIDNIEDFLNAFEGDLYAESRAYLLGEKERLIHNKEADVWETFHL